MSDGYAIILTLSIGFVIGIGGIIVLHELDNPERKCWRGIVWPLWACICVWRGLRDELWPACDKCGATVRQGKFCSKCGTKK